MLSILHSFKIKVKIDHDSLKYFLQKGYLQQRNENEWQRCWDYFEIIYKKVKKNVIANALSMKDEDVEVLLYAISII